MTVQVITVGGRQVTVVNLDSTAGAPVGAGAVRPTLARLADVDDVDTAPTDVPLVLRRWSDGKFRPEPSTAEVDPALLGGFVDAAVGPAVDQVVTELGLNRPRDYTHTQGQPAALWLVEHHLGFLPTFTAYDTEGRPVMHAGIAHPVPGEVSEVRFGFPLVGTGYAS